MLVKTDGQGQVKKGHLPIQDEWVGLSNKNYLTNITWFVVGLSQRELLMTLNQLNRINEEG